MKRFLLITGIILGALAIFVFVAMQPEITPVGGRWVLVTPASLMIEAGARYNFIARRPAFSTTRPIRELVYDTADLGDDCVYYASTLHDVAHFCACGDRRPLLIASDTVHPFERDDIRRLVRQEWNGDGQPAGRLETIDLMAVKRRALQQPVTLTPNPPAVDAGVASELVTEAMPAR